MRLLQQKLTGRRRNRKVPQGKPAWNLNRDRRSKVPPLMPV